MQGGGHRHRRGRSRRTASLLQPSLLLLLHYGPAHGYTLFDQLEEFGLGNLNPSVVYRALRDMEEQGWVTSTWDREQTQGPPRRVYRLTALGDEVLSLWIQDLEETRGQIDYLVRAHFRHTKEGAGEHHER